MLSPGWLLLVLPGLWGLEIPDQVDPFLELLFETPECEPVVSNADFLIVDTVQCKPFQCDFPHQVCMRKSSLLNEDKANQCRDIPDRCITAANGGIPVPRETTTLQTLPPTPPSSKIQGSHHPDGVPDPSGALEGDFEEENVHTVTSTPNPRPHPRFVGNHLNSRPICEQGIPTGRFCGFALKYTYNRETGQCEKFWFPGCRTADTNDNLFDDEAQCRQVTSSCHTAPGRVAPPPPPPPPPPGGVVGAGVDGASRARPAEYGGGPLGMGGGGVTQPPNFIRLIANTIREVGGGGGGASGKPAGVNMGNILKNIDPAQFANLFQQFG